MRLAIVGSRKWRNWDKIREVLHSYINRYGDDLVVVSGGAVGADYIGKRLALDHRIKYVEFPPSHAEHNKYCVLTPDNYGKAYSPHYFFERNLLIAQYADEIIAFISGKSVGTLDTVRKAELLGKKVHIYYDSER